MTAPRQAVWTIPAGVPFLDALAAGIVAGTGPDPLALSRVTVLLPTRRAGRALCEAFLRQTGGAALLLPRVRPLGDVDDDELALGEETAGADLPPAILPLRRRLMLARTILALEPRDSARTAPQAVELAAALAHFLDQVQTEGLDFAALDRIVPEEHAKHWQDTVRFLKILTTHWPSILANEGVLDPAERRNRALAALAKDWAAHPPAGPVIAAGSTGSIPATAGLLRVVAGLPRGAVVLPGLDRDMDEAGWAAIGPTHPQYGIKELLHKLGVTRGDVATWPHGAASADPGARRRLVSVALQPAEATAGWRDLGGLTADAVRGLVRIEALHPQQEAQIIAVLLREALEKKERTAALVTPDRDLARRVAAELQRFGLAVDDSAGRPLGATPPMVFLRLLAEAVAEGVPPVKLLALLKHPLAAGGIATAAFRARARELEMAILRGPRAAPGFASLVAALRAAAAPELAAWLDGLAAAARDFAVLAGGEASPADLLRAHVALAEIWAATDSEPGPARLWATDAGAAAAAFVAELAEVTRDFPPIHGSAYPAFLDSCLAGRVVRPAWGGHPRLHILGPLEARLLSFDLTILGGLNEGTWPHEGAADPWMSRPMRETFGLPPLERRIGLAAHDVAQALAGTDVVLTRALRVDEAPTVPSRWLQRLDAVLQASGLDARLDADRTAALVAWQAALDEAVQRPLQPPPEPRPPVAARPRRLSVTQVETWRRDPYALYARHVLRLRPLQALDQDIGAAERGTFVHAALHRFVLDYPDLPPDAVAALLRIGEREFGAALEQPGVWAFWWPRFEAVAGWFVVNEALRRPAARPVATEGKGRLVLDTAGGDFTLTARADRIDRQSDGSLVIIDYKTGGIPSQREVREGYAPQLPLEAAIARAGGFSGIAAAPVAELAYWQVTGGDPPGKETIVKGDTGELADEALDGLRRMIEVFDDRDTPYLPQPDPNKAPRYNDYAHLARVKEWSAEDES